MDEPKPVWTQISNIFYKSVIIFQDYPKVYWTLTHVSLMFDFLLVIPCYLP